MEIGELIEIVEGKTRVLVPNLEKYKVGKKIEPAHAPVFYNPAMEINRSISVLAIDAYSKLFNYKDLTICEPLSGTGVRGLRYIIETSSTSKVIMNDIDIKAYKLIKLNCEKLNVFDKVEIYNMEASKLLLNLEDRRVDVVDIDPFGSPIKFIDPALRCLRHNGLLCVTATDVGVLMGRYALKCIRRYGSRPLHAAPISREIGLRILIASIARIALQHDYGIKPLLAYYEGHYYRVFMIISKDTSDAIKTMRNLGYILYDRDSGDRVVIYDYPICKSCREYKNYEIAGPIWIGHIIDLDFVREMYHILNSDKRYLTNNEKLVKLIETFIDEAVFSDRIYYSMIEICKGLNREISVKKFIEFLKKCGIDASKTHMDSRALRSYEDLDTLREFAKYVVGR